MALCNNTERLKSAFVGRLLGFGEGAFGGTAEGLVEYRGLIGAAASMAVEVIDKSDALYHDAEHTMMVTLVGQEILRGKLLAEGGVSARDWAHFTLSLLCHDIGYVRGICPGDGSGSAVVDGTGRTVAIPEGATDAWLTPFHVERGKLFVRTRFGDHPLIDPDVIVESIEHTRFPVPEAGDSTQTADWAGLVRAADLIGQLADPDYLRKLPALWHEFQETGANERMGNATPQDLRDTYPEFFWNQVHPYIRDGIAYLEVTQDGRSWLASLYSHVFYQVHRSVL